LESGFSCSCLVGFRLCIRLTLQKNFITKNCIKLYNSSVNSCVSHDRSRLILSHKCFTSLIERPYQKAWWPKDFMPSVNKIITIYIYLTRLHSSLAIPFPSSLNLSKNSSTSLASSCLILHPSSAQLKIHLQDVTI